MHRELSAKVLLVEDSKSFASMMSTLIRQSCGFDVDIAGNLIQVKQLLRGPQQYFVAIVDYHLPDAIEGQSVDAVVAHDIPTIVFTGKPDESIREKLWLTGIADYANKRGAYNLEHVLWMLRRIHANRNVDILLVDHNADACEKTRALLQTQSFRVHSANSETQAHSILRQNNNIRIVILDVDPGRASGLELAASIREKHSRAAMEIIATSAKPGDDLAAQVIKSGASDFIPKPLLPENFLSRVNNAADRIEAYFKLDDLNQLKNRFLGTVAHDIRGPLGAIKIASDVLLKQSPPPERIEKLLNMIRNNSEHLISDLDTLLDISAFESGAPKLVTLSTDISDLLHERIELYELEAASKGINISANIAASVKADIDSLKIKQVCDNLLTNAIKYSPPDSTIEVALAYTDNRIRLSVTDAGPGISQTEQEKLFKAFCVLSTRTTGGEKKTGLGLAISKSIVDAHKGKIYYQHDASMHSTFFVELPTQPPKL